MREKIQTGIDGLDSLLGGGIPKRNQMLLAGGPGAGKTLISFEYIYRNALAGKKSALFSIEETSEMIIENAKEAFSNFKDIDKLIESKKLIIEGLEEERQYLGNNNENRGGYAFNEWLGGISSIIEAEKIDAAAIDSISALKLLIKDQLDYRNLSINMINTLRKLNATTIITAEMNSTNRIGLMFEPEFFIYDGIIILYLSTASNNRRIKSLEVIKNRGSGNSTATVPYEITADGIVLENLDLE